MSVASSASVISEVSKTPLGLDVVFAGVSEPVRFSWFWLVLRLPGGADNPRCPRER